MIDRPALEAALGAADPPELLALAGELQGRAWARLSSAPSKVASGPETNISVAEAARRLGMSRDFIYKNATSLPFVARIGARVVCSASHVERYRTARLGRGDGTR